jgi:hypothetical protein
VPCLGAVQGETEVLCQLTTRFKDSDVTEVIARNLRPVRFPIICSGVGSSIIRDLVSRGAEYNINMLTKTLVAAGAIMVCTDLAFASDKQVAAEATPTPTPPAPLMYLLDQAGLAKPLKDLGINLYGYVQAGYFYDFSAPHSEDGPTFIGYNKFKNSFILDNISLNLEATTVIGGPIWTWL